MSSRPPSASQATMLLRARLVLPLSAPLIQDGAVGIRAGKIVFLRPWSQLSSDERRGAIDLGEQVLLPGLVNSHCHLDYTDMAGQMPPPREFIDWLKIITSAKAGWNYSDFAASWLAGARMLLRTGTTTVADIEAVPQLLAEALACTPLRVISFLEMTGIKAKRLPGDVLAEALAWIDSLPGACAAGLSPHAPYSTLPELLRLAGKIARKKKWLTSIHAAESFTEFEMFRRGRGKMYEWIAGSGREMSDCGAHTPIEHLEAAAFLGKNTLVIHANYLARQDVDLLALRGASVVHCPRSHFYFRHEAFPLRRLLGKKVNVCLGTDSLASVWKRHKDRVQLSLWDEMRQMAKAFPKLRPRQLIEFCTLNGAKALSQPGKIGCLQPRARADLICVPYAGGKKEVYAQLLQTIEVDRSMIGGRWVWNAYEREVPENQTEK